MSRIIESFTSDGMTLTVTAHGRAVTQWFRLAPTWPLLLSFLRTSESEPHIYIGGVASGQEAYSLAMLLEAHGIQARITATDFNPELIAIAERGSFSRESVEQAALAGVLPPTTVMGFFRVEGPRLRVADALRERVTFAVADLRTVILPSADLILLRNLWRHLGDSAAARLAREAARALPQLGILSVGGADYDHDDGTPTGLDRMLRDASLKPVGVGELYFRP